MPPQTDIPAPAQNPSGRRNASLDILRAAAILMVLLCHGTTSFSTPVGLDFLALGGVGVDLFFCLSGWLLGKQLCEEFKKTGTIELRRFWLRRWLRTLPAYYAVLLFTYAQALYQGRHPESWQYLIFLQNYMPQMPFFGVSWSLCVEEHFYLLVAPLLLLFCRTPRLCLLVPLLMLIPLASRLSMGWVNENWGWHIDKGMTHLRFDQCAVGVLLAALAVFAPAWWDKLCRALVFIVPVALLMAAMNVYWRISGTRGDWDALIWSLIFASLVALANSGPYWKSGLKLPGSRYLADRAYAVYLLHPEAIAVMNRVEQWFDWPAPALYVLHLAGILALSLLAGEVLYRCIELPFMRMREKFHSSRSTHGTPAAK